MAMLGKRIFLYIYHRKKFNMAKTGTWPACGSDVKYRWYRYLVSIPKIGIAMRYRKVSMPGRGIEIGYREVSIP